MSGDIADPFLRTFFSRIPKDVAASFTAAQLDAVKLAFGARYRGEGKHLGRPYINGETEQAVRAALAAGKGIRKVARECGVGTSVVQRIKAEHISIIELLSSNHFKRQIFFSLSIQILAIVGLQHLAKCGMRHGGGNTLYTICI